MNRKELYQKTVDLLLDAYNDGKLEHGLCTRCAVGNICGGREDWAYDFATISKDVQEKTTVLFLRSELDALYEKVGYSMDELAKIEFAFENSIYNTERESKIYDKRTVNFGYEEADYNYYYWAYTNNKKKGQFIGLCAVLDVLKEIHEAPIKEVTENKIRLEGIAKNKFAVAI